MKKDDWDRARTRLGWRLWRLESSELCREAQRRTGLEEFGTPPPEPGLSILLNSLEREAALHPLGRFLMRMHVRDLLETRLKLAQAWREKPGALEAERIERPVFIIGMPRSGSTFLHELMAEDSSHRSPRVWEVMFPVLAARGGQRDRARCIRKAELCLWWFRRLAPQADSVYPMRALTPHECVAIQSLTFLSEEFVSTCSVPSFEAFLHSADLTPVYAWERRFLQHLQLGCPAKRWVLKSPDHVCGLEALFSVFPDAFIVQTHRNPLAVLKSSTRLTQVLRGLYGPRGDFEQVREREATVLADRTERFIRFRDLHPELAERFIDGKYADLVADPLAVVRRIYQQCDTPLTDLAVERMECLAATRSRYVGRRSSADLPGVKPEPAVESSRFAHYCSRFGLTSPEAEAGQ